MVPVWSHTKSKLPTGIPHAATNIFARDLGKGHDFSNCTAAQKDRWPLNKKQIVGLFGNLGLHGSLNIVKYR